MKKPKFDKHDGAIQTFRNGKEIDHNINIETNMKVTTRYQGVSVYIKVAEIMPENVFTGTIVGFAEYTSPMKYKDLSFDDTVEFCKDHIILVDTHKH